MEIEKKLANADPMSFIFSKSVSNFRPSTIADNGKKGINPTITISHASFFKYPWKSNAPRFSRLAP